LLLFLVKVSEQSSVTPKMLDIYFVWFLFDLDNRVIQMCSTSRY